MRGSLTGDALYAHLLMQRQVDPRLFLMVEGGDELTILTGHVDTASVFVLVGGGKPTLLRAAELVHKGGIDRTLALIDRDLDDLTGESTLYPPTVVATDGYDLDSDVVASDWELLRRSAVANAGPQAVLQIESISGTSFDSLIRLHGSQVAALRLVNAEGALGLNLRDFPFHDVLESDCRPKDRASLVDRANNRSARKTAFTDIELALDEAARRLGSAAPIGGHDLFGVTAALLRNVGATKVGAKNVAVGLHTAVSCAVMKSLSTYRKIEDWAASYSRRAFNC